MKDSEMSRLVERSCWPLQRWTNLCDSEVESSRRLQGSRIRHCKEAAANWPERRLRLTVA